MCIQAKLIYYNNRCGSDYIMIYGRIYFWSKTIILLVVYNSRVFFVHVYNRNTICFNWNYCYEDCFGRFYPLRLSKLRNQPYYTAYYLCLVRRATACNDVRLAQLLLYYWTAPNKKIIENESTGNVYHARWNWKTWTHLKLNL